jgi:hypothetical protein
MRVGHTRPTFYPVRDAEQLERAMTAWEYATVPLLPHNTKQILDNWGDDGWELVAVHTAEVGGTIAFFKRPKG